MPKIPTFESRSRPTAEVASIKSNIQLSPTATPAAALSKVASSMEDYYIKQRDNVEKLEAKKKYLELKGKSDLIIEKNKNNADEFGAISSYTEEFNSLKTQELSKVQNRRVKKKLEEYLALEEVEGISTIKKNSFDAFEKDSTSIYNTEQETLAGKYTIETDPNKKDLIIKQRKESAIEFNNMHQLGKAALDKELKKIDNDSILFDVDVLMSRKQYGAAKAMLSDPKNLSKIDNEQRQKKLIAIEKESAELNENNYYASNLLKGNNVLIGAKFTSTTEKKAIQHTERILFSSAEKQQKNPEETFAIVDGVMSQNGIVSPTYKDLMEAGYNTGSITTFDSAADIPTTLIQAVKAAETADKFGRLNVYTNKEQERFYKNIVLLKKVKGFDDYQAIKQAKEFEQNYDANLLKGSNKQRGKTFEEIEQKFSDSKSSNINELRGYAGQLYDMYIMLGIDDNKARKQVVEDIKKNVTEIDNHSYLKRDIVAFQAIDGIDNLPVYKKYIIKNNMDKDEDPDDYYLRHNGGGQFEIRRRVDLSTVYNKENKEMIFYAKDLLKLKEQQTEEFKKDILEQQIKTQELRIFEVEQETMMP
jgi:hypothetical protein